MKKSLIIISLAAIVLVGLFGGCSHDIKGPARVNIPPTVKFTNIPVERARFSSDTTVYWYGTDVDGFIVQFRYTVVESTIVIDPETFIDEDGTGFIVPDTEINWVVLDVDLANTGTKDRVRMSADIADPVRKYVASYVFLQALDNLGDKSQIVYRAFLKNNHFPETDISANSVIAPYINATSPNGILEGVVLGFSGSDPIDYRLGDEPPFQYRWKVFGPFSQTDVTEIRSQYIDSVFMDTYGDLYRKGETLYVYTGLDTTIDSFVIPHDTAIDSTFNKFLVDILRGSNPYGRWHGVLLGVDPVLDSMVVDSSDYDGLDGLTKFDSTMVDSSANWTLSQTAQLFDIFRKQYVTPEADTTRQMFFIAWCQARDDANVPDKIPAFEFFTAIEPKFEREVLVIDFGSYTRASTYNYPVFPVVRPFSQAPGQIYRDSFMVRNIYGQYVNNWDPDSFDATNLLHDTTINGIDLPYSVVGCTQDYFAIKQLYGDDTTKAMTLRDILKHKIMILVKDEADGVVELESDIGLFIIDGINAGMSCWIMARAGAGPGLYEDGGVPLMPPALTTYFGVEELHTDDWQRRTQSRIDGFQPRIEDFVGALPIQGIDLPILAIDTVLLENRYLWDSIYPYYYYPFRAPLQIDTTDTIVYGTDTVYVFKPMNFTGKQSAGGNDSGHAALPEVGYVVRSYGATPLYLYYSIWAKYGIVRPPYVTGKEGTVIAVSYDHPIFRTAYFPFSVLALDSVSGQEMFNKMMDWLSEQPYIQTGKIRSAGPFGPALNKEVYRQESRRLHDLKSQGLLKILGGAAR